MEKIQEILNSEIPVNAGAFYSIIIIAVLGIIFSVIKYFNVFSLKEKIERRERTIVIMNDGLDKANKDNEEMLKRIDSLKNQINRKENLILKAKEELQTLKTGLKPTPQVVTKPTARIRKPKTD